MTHSNDSDSDQSDGGKGHGSAKSRRELPAGAVSTLKAWLLSPEHFTHPYPTPQDQVMLMQKTGIDKKQLKNWFTNARRRIWKPLLKKQLEQGTLAVTGTGSGSVAVGIAPGLMTHPGAPAPAADNTSVDMQASQPNYQQAVQPQEQSQMHQQYDSYGNPVYTQQQYSSQPYYASSGSIGSLPAMGGYQGSSAGTSTTQMSKNDSHAVLSKNDSHAVLMELFARDQDLVRQASESAKMKAAAAAKCGEHQATLPPTKSFGSSSKLLAGVPSMNSWPHFSSISSLNNLGTMTGVKSIASLSGADLVSQGNVNKMGNLAQVKSLESMGKNDSYAFLEVFFGDRGSSTNLSGLGRGIKREREDDDDIGLSLDAEESPSTTTMKQTVESNAPRRAAGAPQPAPLPAPGSAPSPETGTLKRAYDDALAARGLISVSRSCEKLTDLALPAKMQRTLSQEYIRQHVQQQQQQQVPTQTLQFGQYTLASTAAPSDQSSAPVSQQYPGQDPGQHSQASGNFQYQSTFALSDPTASNASVEVSSTTTCAICQKTNVDTQLRPCGHMFHERCLKPSLQTPMGQPRCPIDRRPMESALLAVPADESTQSPPLQPPRAWNEPKSAFQSGPVSTETSSS